VCGRESEGGNIITASIALKIVCCMALCVVFKSMSFG
jgi:hypothetical protein